MIPFGREAVTLYHREEQTDAAGRTHQTWRRILLDGCSWKHAAKYSLSNAREVVCRIPAGQMRPDIGDAMVLGHVSDEADSALALFAIMEKYREHPGAFRVAAINDNMRTGFPLPHYAVRGE